MGKARLTSSTVIVVTVRKDAMNWNFQRFLSSLVWWKT